MEHPQGLFGWVDLSTTDVDAAKAFYSELFGWEDRGRPDADGPRLHDGVEGRTDRRGHRTAAPGHGGPGRSLDVELLCHGAGSRRDLCRGRRGRRTRS